MSVGYVTHSLEQQILFACLRVDYDPNDIVKKLLSQHPDWPTLIELARQHGLLPFFYQQLKKDVRNPRSPGCDGQTVW